MNVGIGSLMLRLLTNFLSLLAALVFPTPVWALSPGQFEGRVVDVDENRLVLTVIADGGSEETAVFVGRGDHAIAKPGRMIRGELVSYAGGLRLQTIWPNDSRDLAVMERLDRQLQQDTLNRGSKAFRGIGEQMPRFALWRQSGELFHSESLRGNYVVLNFIFTRCRMANMCPAATERMRILQELAGDREVDDLQLVSVTLDPEYDTPGIFHSYATDRDIDSSNFHFLSGPDRVAANLRTQLGVLAEPDEVEIIRHTLTTTLIDPAGRIIYRIPGSMWDPEVFLRQIDRHRERNR